MNPGFGPPKKDTTSWMVSKGYCMSHSLSHRQVMGNSDEHSVSWANVGRLDHGCVPLKGDDWQHWRPLPWLIQRSDEHVARRETTKHFLGFTTKWEKLAMVMLGPGRLIQSSLPAFSWGQARSST